jgi:hypothetical protein
VSNHSNSIVGCASLDIHQTKSTQGFKVENIVLKQSGRAKGSYRFQVHHFSGSVTAPWTAVISDRENISIKEGIADSITQGSNFDVVTLIQE